MPNRDKTGPQGKGPKTGRQEGPCEGVKPTGTRPGFGRGIRAGRRPRGFGRRNA